MKKLIINSIALSFINMEDMRIQEKFVLGRIPTIPVDIVTSSFSITILLDELYIGELLEDITNEHYLILK